MADSLPTMWPLDAHTQAKHAILEEYLKAWLKIITRQFIKIEHQIGKELNREIYFVDAFAGPGKYSKEEEGSPVIALNTAAKFSSKLPKPVHFLFIEKDKDRHGILTSVINQEREKLIQREDLIVEEPENGDATELISTLLKNYEARSALFGPALFFMDQFGFSDVPMELIRKIMSIPQCEIFELINYRGMNRFIGDETKSRALDRTFGGDEWTGAINLPVDKQRPFLLKQYLDAVKKRAGVKYSCHFTMFDKDDRPIYWLIFCTQSLKGLEEMKRAMWKVDKTGACKFSDRDNPGQLRLLENSFDQKWLAEELLKQHGGKTLKVSEIKEFVLTDTPCYRFKQALKHIETSSKNNVSVVDAPDGRRKGAFPNHSLENIRIRFGDNMLF